MIQTTIPDGWITAEASMPWQALALTLVDRLPFGVILTDQRARIVELNRRARKLVDGQSGLRVMDGRIVATACMVDAALQRCIASVLDSSGREIPSDTRITVPVSHSHRAIQVVIMSTLCRPQRTDSPHGAVLFLFGPGCLSAETTALMDLYGLTPAEAQVACRLVAGEGPAQIGAATGTTLNTVRTHIKRIFTKSGCRTQAEFVHAVLTGPASLGAGPA